MEAKLRWTLVTAIAPIAWGTTYWVTHRCLPSGYPLYGAAIRALPAGLLLLLVRRRLPTGSWWWRSLVLGSLNMGAFFALVYLAAQTLPTSVASTVMATSSVVLMLFAWAALTAWQLVAGGLILTVAAVAAEGAPPTLDASALAAFGYVSVVATALAFAAWFAGLRGPGGSLDSAHDVPGLAE